MKKLYKNLSIVMVSLCILLKVSTASAAIITFDYTDTVTVGDNFMVNVFADIGTDELTTFGFNLTSLTNNTSFLNASIHSAFTQDFLNDVGGLLFDPLDIITGNIQVATLMFSADTIGTDTINLLGNASNFGGLYTLFGGEDIDASFNINVIDVTNNVPAPAALSLFAIGLLTLVLNTRKKKRLLRRPCNLTK